MDWKLLIADLAAKGWSQPQIAKECDCGQATVSDLANGRSIEPRYALGEKLKALHAQVVPTQPRSPTNHPGERATDRKAVSRG